MTAPLTLDPTPTLAGAPDPRGLGGLLALVDGAEKPLPLVGVRVRTTLAGAVARTTVEQRFRNPYAQPLEVVHLFPLPEEGAVLEVELHAGEVVVRAECRERGAAEAAFAEARRAGHQAALLTAERADVHTLRATNLPPGEEVRVRIVVAQVLAAEDGLLRWRFPTVVAPRYLPGRTVGHDGSGVGADTDRVPDGSRITPPLRLGGGTSLDLEVRFAGRPARLQSSLHALRVDLDDAVVVAPSGAATCDRDFVLAFSWSGAQGGTHAWTDGEATLVVVDPPAVAVRTLPRDAVFLVDISGSMGGPKMGAAKTALRTALRGLLPGDRFRVIAFDDRVEPHAPGLVPMSDAELARAERFVAGLGARGGTEMLAPLQEALSGERPAGRLRTVLLITDGQAGNESELAAAVAHRAQGARVFTLGIDTAVNGALLGQLARLGGGACTLCTPADDIEAVVARIEARFGSPVLDALRAEGEEARPEGRTVFVGQPRAILVRGAGPVRLRGASPDGEFTTEAAATPCDAPIAALWARERIAWLEDRLVVKPFEEEALRPEIVRLALGAGLASRYTAFVAVERSRRVEGERLEVVQPVELPHVWEAGRGGGVYASPPPGPYGGARAQAPGMAPPPPSMSAPAPRMDLARGAPAKAKKSALSRMVDAFRGPSGADADDDDVQACAAPTYAAESAPPPLPAAAADPAARLVQSQGADGSWGNDVRRTAAALVALLRLGHTRTAGLRKRAVQKAAAWLQRSQDPVALAALAALSQAEQGALGPLPPSLAGLHSAGPEGAMLAALGA